MEVWESHNGADTIPVAGSALRVAFEMSTLRGKRGAQTILEENVEALLDEQVGIENDKAEGKRQHIIARPLLEEVSDGSLHVHDDAVSLAISVRSRKRPNGCLAGLPRRANYRARKGVCAHSPNLAAGRDRPGSTEGPALLEGCRGGGERSMVERSGTRDRGRGTDRDLDHDHA